MRLGAAEPVTPWERQLIAAVPHRHTHRGPFSIIKFLIKYEAKYLIVN